MEKNWLTFHVFYLGVEIFILVSENQHFKEIDWNLMYNKNFNWFRSAVVNIQQRNNKAFMRCFVESHKYFMLKMNSSKSHWRVIIKFYQKTGNIFCWCYLIEDVKRITCGVICYLNWICVGIECIFFRILQLVSSSFSKWTLHKAFSLQKYFQISKYS